MLDLNPALKEHLGVTISPYPHDLASDHVGILGQEVGFVRAGQNEVPPQAQILEVRRASVTNHPWFTACLVRRSGRSRCSRGLDCTAGARAGLKCHLWR